jgi:hypothetical protein
VQEKIPMKYDGVMTLALQGKLFLIVGTGVAIENRIGRRNVSFAHHFDRPCQSCQGTTLVEDAIVQRRCEPAVVRAIFQLVPSATKQVHPSLKGKSNE